jgi:UDP-N-acetyl-D-glucosamine dehydrogenase
MIEVTKTKVTVIGQGYVGLPLSMRACEVGYQVVGFDVDAGRVAALNQGRSHVGDVSDQMLQDGLRLGYRAASSEDALEGFDYAVISVPTPLKDGLPNLKFVESAAEAVGRFLTEGACVILESTTYPGTTEELVAPILERESGLRRDQYFLGYSPERVDPGNDKFNLRNTPKVVSGDREASLRVVSAFFATLIDEVVEVRSCAEAEMVKLLENTFRHVNIALINEVARFAHGLGIDVWRVVEAASSKPFGFMRFTPGPGVGGHCLPIDPSYLAWRVKQDLGHNFRFVELANDINGHMPEYVIERITLLMNNHCRALNGLNVVLLGLSYKASTGDWRESPSARIADVLNERGAKVQICDPHVLPIFAGKYGVHLVEYSTEILRSADLVVVLVDHPEFEPEVISKHSKLVFDTKNLLEDTIFEGETL